jgi:methylated-DNA-[protein]-cysteine S-methyltransferase
MPVFESAQSVSVSTFNTAFGWFGLLSNLDGELLGLKIGHPTEAKALRAVTEMLDDATELIGRSERSEIEQRLIEFTEGEPADFSDVQLVFPAPLTKFQSKVIAATRRVSFGETRSYTQIADQSGSPRAARAVGTCMKNNRFPIIVPCHRVVAASGLGGFSAPRGVSLKRQLLTMEAERAELTDRSR